MAPVYGYFDPLFNPTVPPGAFYRNIGACDCAGRALLGGGVGKVVLDLRGCLVFFLCLLSTLARFCFW